MQLLFYEEYLSSADCYRNLSDSLLFWEEAISTGIFTIGQALI